MTFTQADHAKAVELYERYKGAEWWPERTEYREGSWCIGTIQGVPVLTISPFHALSAIAWAMVERLGPIIVSPGVSIYTSTGQFVSRVEWQVTIGTDTFGSETRFLALAAAVEGMDTGR